MTTLTPEVFGPDRPRARRAAADRVERARTALDAMSASPGMGVDPSSDRYGASLRELRNAERAAAAYWAG